MADGIVLNAGAGGDTVAADDIAGTKYQIAKIAHGALDSATLVSTSSGLPVQQQGTWTVDASGATVPVSGPLTDTQLRASAVPVSLAAVPSHAVTNAGTFAVQATVGAGAATIGKAEDAASADADVGVPAMAVRKATPANTSGLDGDYEMLQMSAGRLWTSATVDAALPAGTNAIGKLAANSGVDIGDVDILSIAAGDNNIGNVDIVTMPNVTLAAGTNTNEVVGDVAHDAAAAGNPVLVAGVAQDMDDTAPPNRVSAESDATRLATDRDGALFVRPYGPQVWSYHLDTSTAQTDATVHAAPGANLSLYVTDIVFSSGAATAINLFFEEGATKVLGPYYLEATAGRGMAVHFVTPKKITANTALTLTTSASIAHCVDVTGFVAQG